MTANVVQATDVVTTHGEGPAWANQWGALRVLDMLAGDIVQIQQDGSATRRKMGAVAALVRPRRRGGWICVTDAGVIAADADDLDADLTPLTRLWSDEDVRPNEGACAPDGTLHMGSMAWDATPGRGELLRVDEQRNIAPVFSDITVSNGLGWTAGGDVAYYVDSATGAIDRCRWTARNGLHARERWVEVPDGSPDGLAVDTDGGVWVALYGAGAVHHYDADGHLTRAVSLPVSQPTSVAFAGPDLTRLVVTTSSHDLAQPEASAGAVFEILGHRTRGVPVHPYAG